MTQVTTSFSDTQDKTSLLKNKNVEVFVDNNGVMFVYFNGQSIFFMTFEETCKPTTFYEGKEKVNSVSQGITCLVRVVDSKFEFTSSSFNDSRDEFDVSVGCFLSFKKLYKSLIKIIIELFNVSNKEANDIFYTIRTCFENCPIPVYKSKFYYF